MSSPRAAESADGWVQVQPGKRGPIKMPSGAIDAFIEEFNRTYRRLGMQAIPRQDASRPAIVIHRGQS